MSDTPTPETDAFIRRDFIKDEWNWRQNASQLERELNEAIKVIRDADLALRKCLNYLIVQPIFTRNNSDIERESETMESVHLALAKLQPFIR
jgi:hypothetical protein